MTQYVGDYHEMLDTQYRMITISLVVAHGTSSLYFHYRQSLISSQDTYWLASPFKRRPSTNGGSLYVVPLFCFFSSCSIFQLSSHWCWSELVPFPETAGSGGSER